MLTVSYRFECGVDGKESPSGRGWMPNGLHCIAAWVHGIDHVRHQFAIAVGAPAHARTVPMQFCWDLSPGMHLLGVRCSNLRV